MAEKKFAPADQQYRDRIASELDTTMLVEAGAGTGKTTCLVSRMVGLLGQGKCEIETLAAITFTRKAAAELRTRFQLALEQAARKASNETQARLTKALDQVERCFIGTIHSFCGRLLRERPVEAGIDPGFVELDEVLDGQLREQAWREHVAALITTDDPLLPELERLGLKISSSTRRSNALVTELDELGLEPAELGPAFLAYAEYTDVTDWPAEPVPLPDLQPCIDALREYIEHIRSVSLPSVFGSDKLMPRYALIRRMAGRFDLDQPAQLMELLEQFEGSAGVTQKMWPGKRTQALAEKERWDNFVQQYADPILLAWREHRYEPVMRTIRSALDVYQRMLRERNALSFQDLLLLSVNLLRDKPEVRRYFRQRFTHLLVDEFQDTDPIQAELMLLLTAEDCEEQDWHQCRPVAGSLFVVGDPKQSIYRFRRADILTYNRVRAIVESAGGETIPLTANFRSTRPIVDWVNNCFSGVFPQSADDYSPVDRPLDVGRVAGGDEQSGVQRLFSSSDLTRMDEVNTYEAEMIARSIRQAIDEKHPVQRSEKELEQGVPAHAIPGDFLIVACKRARLPAYVRKLQQYEIPHSVTGGSALNEVPELELLHTCLRAVARSDDPIALVAVLRSELFGLSDTALYDFRRRGGRFSYHAPVPTDLPEAETAAFEDAFARLQTYSRWLRQMPAASAIERIAADLGLIVRACAAEQGGARAGGLLKAIELLRSVDGQLTVGDYVDALARLVNRDEAHDGVSVRSSLQTQVRVMNLHQCKGLEAPFVFLVDPSGDRKHPVEVHIDRSGDAPRGYLPIYGLKRSQYGSKPLLAQPPGWDDLEAEEQKFLNAETNRLLYVAATRAGMRLVISQRGARNGSNPWRLFDPYLPTGADFQEPDPIPRKSPATLEIAVSDWKGEVDAIDQRWQAARRPTYAIEAIKESAIAAGPKPHGSEKQGAEWGQVLHTLLEAAMKQSKADLRGVALAALENEELPASLLDDVLETVQRVIDSDLWQRAKDAEQVLTEVPLAMPVAADDSSLGVPTVLRGVIDLVFHEPNGWVIVDYKSERVEQDQIPALVSYYKPQVDAYVRAWEQVTGQQVSEVGLFFTHTGVYATGT